MKTYGFHIDRAGNVIVLTRPRYLHGRIGRDHITSGLPAGTVWRERSHWRRSGSGQYYPTQADAGTVAAAVAVRDANR